MRNLPRVGLKLTETNDYLRFKHWQVHHGACGASKAEGWQVVSEILKVSVPVTDRLHYFDLSSWFFLRVYILLVNPGRYREDCLKSSCAGAHQSILSGLLLYYTTKRRKMSEVKIYSRVGC